MQGQGMEDLDWEMKDASEAFSVTTTDLEEE